MKTCLLSNRCLNRLCSLEIDRDEWNILESVEFVLRPFMEATKVISGRHYATIGTSFFAMCVIKDFLEDQSDLDQPCINHLKKLLLTQLRKYFEHDTEQLELIKVSIFLQLVLSHRCSSSDTHTSILLPSELSTELIDRQSSVISSKCTKMQFSLRGNRQWFTHDVIHRESHGGRFCSKTARKFDCCFTRFRRETGRGSVKTRFCSVDRARIIDVPLTCFERVS